LWAGGAAEIYAAGEQTLPGGTVRPLLWKFDGTGWADLPLPTLATNSRFDAVAGAAEGGVYVFGREPAGGGATNLLVLHSTDGGGSWSTTRIRYTGTQAPVIADAGASGAGAVLAVGYGGAVGFETPTTSNEAFLLRYDGAAWTLSVQTGRVYRGLSVSGRDVYVAGYGMAPGGTGRYAGFLRVSGNAGETWTELAAPGTLSAGMLMDAWAASPTDVHVVGYGGTVLRFDGTRWTATMGARRPTPYSVWGPSSDEAYVVGDRGLILHGVR
jgi:hypothetical protein